MRLYFIGPGLPGDSHAASLRLWEMVLMVPISGLRKPRLRNGIHMLRAFVQILCKSSVREAAVGPGGSAYPHLLRSPLKPPFWAHPKSHPALPSSFQFSKPHHFSFHVPNMSCPDEPRAWLLARLDHPPFHVFIKYMKLTRALAFCGLYQLFEEFIFLAICYFRPQYLNWIFLPVYHTSIILSLENRNHVWISF